MRRDSKKKRTHIKDNSFIIIYKIIKNKLHKLTLTLLSYKGVNLFYYVVITNLKTDLFSYRGYVKTFLKFTSHTYRGILKTHRISSKISL